MAVDNKMILSLLPEIQLSTHTESDAEKMKEIMDIIIRSNEIFRDAVSAVKKANNFIEKVN